jgi:hypothetical protein
MNRLVHDFPAWAQSAAPFSVLFVFLFVLDNVVAIWALLWLEGMLCHCNKVVSRTVLARERGRAGPMMAIALFSAIQVAGILVYTYEDRAWGLLLFEPLTARVSLFRLAWMILINDFLVRYASLVVKTVLVWLPFGRSPELAKFSGHMLGAVEEGGILYRSLAVFPPWLFYLKTRSYGWTSSAVVMETMHWFVIFSYAFLKSSLLLRQLRTLIIRILSASRKKPDFGDYISAEEALEAGGECSICQEEGYRTPVKLPCGHVFDEECITEWFERGVDKTCPLCRAQVPEAMNQLMPSDGTTSLLPQFF